MDSVSEDQPNTNSATECSNESSEQTPKEGNSTETNNDVKIKTGASKVNLFGNRPSNICSPFSMQNSHKPVFGSNRSILKPSALFTDANIPSPSVTFGNNVCKAVKLKPSVLSNPFANNITRSNDVNSNCDVDQDKLQSLEKPDSTNEEAATSSSAASAPVFVPLTSSSSNSSSSAVSSTTLNSASLLISSSSSNNSPSNNAPSSTSVSSEYVFGQNLHERVTMENENPFEAVTQNGITSSEMLFSAAIKSDNVSHEFSNGNSKTLSMSAKEYEEARSVKRKYDEVAVVTGEEDEENVLQLNCKLFAFDNTTSTWSERGRGILRVNDKESSEGRSSRLVVRLAGNYRLVLNTKIWNEMTVELASKKSVRLTAIDSDGQVRIYLIISNPKDAEQLYNVLSSRIQKKRLKTSVEESTFVSAEEN